MKNDANTKKKLLNYIVLIYTIIVYLNLKIACEHFNNLNENERENIDIYKAIIFDAGSTGTRVYIYNYKIVNDIDINIFIPAISYKVSPGIVYILNNYFTGNEHVFYDYFKKIKNFINENIEKEQQQNAVIIFRASGGFRLLSINKSERYINFLKDYLYKNFNEFLLIDELLIKVLSGKEEAILSFVSIYALLEKSSRSNLIFLNKSENDNEKENKNENEKEISNDSIGVIEMGGASAQIVIKVPLSKMNDDIINFFNYKDKESDKNTFIKENYKNRNIVKIKLFHEDIFLYCKSYLVLGRQNTMKTYLHYIVHKNKKRGKLNKFIHFSCFPRNFKFIISDLFKTSIEEHLEEYDGKRILNKNEYVGIGTGDLNLCREDIQMILNHSKIDDLPFKLKRFIKIYAIENFHHFVTDSLNIPESYNPLLIDTNMYLQKAEELCPLTVNEITKLINPNSNIEKAQTSCFGLVFSYEFLRYVFKIDNPISFYSTNYINNIIITWTIAVLLMEIPLYIGLIKNRKKKANYHHDEL